MSLLSIIQPSGLRLGYEKLLDKQVEAVSDFVGGNDVFVSFPTGYGKSAIYAMLPLVFDSQRGQLIINVSNKLATVNNIIFFRIIWKYMHIPSYLSHDGPDCQV